MTDWLDANQRHLTGELARVRAAVERVRHEVAVEAAPGSDPFALEVLAGRFGLSPFERDVVLLCAGVELDASFAAACGTPSFGLALGTLADAHWSALNPAAPLRRWRLVEVGAASSLAAAPLRIDERVLHFLTGVSYVDERLQGLVEPVPPGAALPAGQEAVARRVSALWNGQSGRPAIQLCAVDHAAVRAVAAAACAGLGLRLHALRAADCPGAPSDREALARTWEREALLGGSALLLERDDDDTAEAATAATAFAERLQALLLVGGRDPLRLRRRQSLRLDVPGPTRAEQRALWSDALGPGAGLNGSLDVIVAQFDLGVQGIEAAGARALALPGGDEGGLARALWDACRIEARPRLDDLAQRIEPAAGWDDLVLPEPQRALLLEIAAHVRRRAQVYDTWGFAAKSGRGLGISALFEGPSGTGKTMAGEVLANELRLDLYRIDLSQVVSKYIGETEKNLRRVFDAAESGGAVLLFDEADALFGKRSEVRDSHDRYANIEVSYLLQRMESYRGLAVLTTNQKQALDQAFLRRLRFVVQFPFPDAAQREAIWQGVFPAATPREAIDVGRLARLNVAGGNIRNIALSAAFAAAEAGEPVRMSHLRRAAAAECAKLEKPLTEVEVAGWT